MFLLIAFLSMSIIYAQNPCINFVAPSTIEQGGLWVINIAPTTLSMNPSVNISYKLTNVTGNVIAMGSRKPNLRFVGQMVNYVSMTVPEFQRLVVVDFSDQSAGIYKLSVKMTFGDQQDKLFCDASASLVVAHSVIPADSNLISARTADRFTTRPLGGNTLQFTSNLMPGTKTFLIQSLDQGALVIPGEAVGLQLLNRRLDPSGVAGTYQFVVPNTFRFDRQIRLLSVAPDGTQASVVVWDPVDPHANTAGGFQQ